MGSNGNKEYAQRHGHYEGDTFLDDCDSVAGSMSFDLTCDRCKKINIVIQLKRKNTANGCSIEEALAASLKVNQIVQAYNLLRTELIDDEYDEPVIQQRQQAQQTYHKTYGAAKARHTYRRRPVKIHTWAEREAYDEDITDD